MKIARWSVGRLVRQVSSYYHTPDIPQPVSHSDWPEDSEWVRFIEDVQGDGASFNQIWNDLFIPSDEEELTTTQWGLQLPNGEVQWGGWSGIDFSTQLSRLKMVATLQKTALDMGLSEGKQTEEFLENYKWQTRQRKTRISYMKDREYALTDPAVSAAPVENSNHDDFQDNSESSTYDPHRDVHAGSLGGDA